MIRSTRFFAFATGVLIAGGALAPAPAAAAQFEECALITSLPAVLAAPGMYCLDASIDTALASGRAINVISPDVTLACNGMVIDNSAAGAATKAIGIHVLQRSGVTIRDCTLIGFHSGIRVEEQAGVAPPVGAIVIDNKVADSTVAGIVVAADGSVVRGNLVSDTGRGTAQAIGIQTRYGVDVLDNTVHGVRGGGTALSYGIQVSQALGTTVGGNRVRAIGPAATANAISLAATAHRVDVRDNVVGAASATPGGIGIRCVAADNEVRRNAVLGVAVRGCRDAGGNVLRYQP